MIMIIGQRLTLDDEKYRVLYNQGELHLVINDNMEAEYNDILLIRITNEHKEDVKPSIEVIEDREVIKTFLSGIFKEAYRQA